MESRSFDPADASESSAFISSDEELDTCSMQARFLVEGNRFQMLVAGVILANTLVMAIQTDNPHWYVPSGCYSKADENLAATGRAVAGNFTTAVSLPTFVPAASPPPCTDVWTHINVVFLIFFLCELILRFFAFGCKGFFCTKGDIGWNIFDFIIVVTATLDFVSSFFTTNSRSKLVMVVRSARILRILRVMRLFKQLKKLKMLVRGLIESFAVVNWIMVFIFGLVYVSAIFCTQLIGHNAQLWGDEAAEIEEFWGSVYRSSITLFQFLTLDNWSALSAQVIEQMPAMQVFFIMFVIFGSFVILSLLTGVMADHMNQVREKEEESETAQDCDQLGTTLETLRMHFTHGNGGLDELTREDFENMFSMPGLVEALAIIDVHISKGEAPTFFDCLDPEGHGILTWEAFKNGICELRVDLAPKHIMELHGVAKRALLEVKRRNSSFRADRVGPSPEAGRQLREAEERLERLEIQVDSIERKIKAVFDSVLHPK
mmetsp:Transcript_112673/g.318342  ORF Transcript_112673/g.318342 Transcript_112673/m.318342 type:complete len:489 (+) Transcript_112673:164-1630(+)